MSHLSQKSSELKPLDIPSWDLVLKRNSIERMKQEKFPLDIIYELPQLIAAGYEAIPEEDIVRLQWWGLYHDKPKVGTFMMRIKIAGGYLTPQKLRAIGEIANRYGKGYGEISTRQNIQLHWIRLDDLPAIFEHLQANGLTTAGGCGDTVRNITGCPVADIDRHQLFDVQPLIQEAARFFYGNRDYSNLPRKHKITIAACPFQCNAPEIHCIALVGVIKDGRKGFAVRIGGGLSSTPRISRDMGVFVPYEEALEVLRAIIDCWKENPRYRLSRSRQGSSSWWTITAQRSIGGWWRSDWGASWKTFKRPKPSARPTIWVFIRKSNRACFTSASPCPSDGCQGIRCSGWRTSQRKSAATSA